MDLTLEEIARQKIDTLLEAAGWLIKEGMCWILCQSALKIAPPSASNIDPPQAVFF